MWIPSWLRIVKNPSRKIQPIGSTRKRAQPASSALLLEWLEDRTLPSTFTVINLNDAGAGSLRAALGSANANPGADTINFSVAGTINVASQLTLSDTSGGTTIDATTAPGYVGAPVVILHGPGTGSFVNGLNVTSPGNTVKGLQINSFNVGLYIVGPNGNFGASGTAANTVVVGNYIGTDGTAAAPNSSGIVIDNSVNNRIGTDGDGANDAAERNVISGNTSLGIQLLQTSTGNVIAGNYVGTNAVGTAAIANNGQAGIEFLPGSNNNRIGTSGQEANNLGERNVISGNKGAGIYLGSTGNIIAGNYIGIAATGSAALGNGVQNGTFNSGIYVDASNNRIGTNGDGLGDDAERNVISANANNGVVINNGNNNILAGNYIGTDATGTVAIGNTFVGIAVTSGTGNRVGTDGNGAGDAAERNVVSGNGSEGILIQNPSTVGTTVAGNFVGTDVNGTAALPNRQGGIHVTANAANTRIGTNADGVSDNLERNLVSGNRGNGIDVTSGAGNVVAGNYIGTDVTGTLDLGNTSFGVGVSATNARIGSNLDGINDTAERNLISGNDADGVGLFGTGAKVAGNYIGTGVNGVSALANSGSGVDAQGATNNIITNNTIANNSQAGVLVLFTSSAANKISQNAIFANGSLGINLSNSSSPVDGVTANDTGDGDTGANNLQNFPVFSLVTVAGGNATINGSLNSAANATFTLEFFASAAGDPSGYGEGQSFLGSATVTTDGSGNVSFTASFAVPAGQSMITATATDSAGNTSEFAQWNGTTTTLASSANPSFAGQSVSFTATVATIESGAGTPTGTVQFKIDGNNFGSPITVSGGTATSGSISTLSNGNHTIVAIYTGNGSFANSTSTATLTQTVATRPTVTPPANQSSAEGVAQSFNLGSFSDPDGGPWNVDVNWGDTTAHTTFNTSSTGSLGSASHAFAEDGTYTVTVTVTDSTNFSGSATFQVQATEPAIVVSATAQGPIGEGSGPGTLTVATFTHGTVAESGISATINWGIAGHSADSGTIVSDGGGSYHVNGTSPTYAEDGSYTVTVTISDESASASGSTTLTVTEPAIVASATAQGPIGEGTGLGAVTVATFTHGTIAESGISATINWGIAGHTADSGTVVSDGGSSYHVTGTSPTYVEDGSYTIAVALSDDTGSAGASTTLTVTEPAIVASATAQGPIDEGTGLGAVTVATFTHGTIAEAGISATIDWGIAGHNTDAGTVVSDGGGSYRVNGTSPTYAEDGSYTITVTISDDSGSASASTTLTVTEPAIVASATAQGPIDEGTALGTVTVATFTHGTVAESSISATINWGIAGHTADSGTVVSDGGGSYHVTGASPVYAEDGSYTITVTISDDNASASASTTLTVAEPAIVASATAQGPIAEGTGLGTTTVAAFSHGTVAESGLSATIDWGVAGHNADAGTVVSDGGGSYHVTGTSPTYAENGSHTITVSISDDSASAVTSTTLAVGEPAIMAAATAQGPIDEGGDLGTVTVATFRHDSGADPAGDFTATIDWGVAGHSADAGSVVSDGGGNYHVSAASPTFAEDGNYLITVTINEPAEGDSTAVSTTLTVREPALAASATAQGPIDEGTGLGSMTVATFTHGNGSDAAGAFAATIDWGIAGHSADSGSVASDGGGSYHVTGTSPTYAEDGSYLITVTISEDNAIATTSTTLTVTEPALVASATAQGPIAEGTGLGTVTAATFTHGTVAEAGIMATINWGIAGHSADAGTVVSDGGGSYHVTGTSPTYAEDGSYTVTVTISNDSASASASTTLTVTEPASVASATAQGPIDEGHGLGTVTVATFTHGTLAESGITATINWGIAGHAADSGTVVSDGGGSYHVTGTSPSYAEDGSYLITVTISEDTASATTSSTLTVTEPAIAASATAQGPISEGTGLGAVTVASFTHGVVAQAGITATINWGIAGHTADSGTVVSDGGGSYHITGTSPTYAEDGSYLITVTISDDSAAATASTTLTVTDPAVVATGGKVINAAEGTSTGSVLLATFTDPGGPEATGDYSADVDWGDGTGTQIAAGSITLNGSTFEVSGAHTYAHETGTPFTVTVTIHHENTLPQTVFSTANVVDNTVPVANADSATTNENTAVTINVIANDTDADGDPLTVTAVTQGAHGSVVNNGDGTVTYTPANNFHGTDSFTYTIRDDGGNSTTGTVSITVVDNSTVTARADAYATPVNTVLTVAAPGVLGNDSDSDGDSLTASAVSLPTHGFLVLNGNGSFTYTPDANFSGTDTFVYKASDAAGNNANATVTITVNGTQAFTITGFKFYDANGDGVNNDGAYVANWTIYLDNNADFSDGYLASVQTNGLGSYTFTGDAHASGPGITYVAGLTAGTWYVYEGAPPSSGWLQTLGGGTPITGNPGPTPDSYASAVGGYKVTLSSNTPASGGDNFGNLKLTSGSGGDTLGFWTNKNGQTIIMDGGTDKPEMTMLDNLNLVVASTAGKVTVGTDFNPQAYTDLQTWLKNANAKDMAYMLSAQLAATALSVEAGFLNLATVLQDTDLLAYRTQINSLISSTALQGVDGTFDGTTMAMTVLDQHGHETQIAYTGGVGLTSEGFISIGDLMLAANDTLGLDYNSSSSDTATYLGVKLRDLQNALQIALNALNNNGLQIVAST